MDARGRRSDQPRHPVDGRQGLQEVPRVPKRALLTTILDGPVGTELIARGLTLAAPDWSARALVEAPDLVLAVHRDYAAAGAQVHTANTFRTKRRARPDDWEKLARVAVDLARRAASPGQRVAGSIAPLEDCYRPDLSPEDPGPEHRELALVLADAGVDLLLCETFPSPREAVIAVREAARTGVETWASLTAGPAASLLTPAEVEEAARACVAEGARAVLVNCVPASRTLAYVERLARVGVPFGAYANAGAAADGVGWGNEEGALRYAKLAKAWIAAGATIVGGCCGTSPAHVRALATLRTP